MIRIITLFIILVSVISCLHPERGFYRNLREEHPVFYQILIDRFYDGEKTNNYKVDKDNPYGFHGGDLRGIYAKTQYLSELGINAVIISPVIDNIEDYVDYQGYKHYGYHGYWPENFDRIEEHFGDFRIISAMSDEFHKTGIAYIQDIVLNHAGYKSVWEKNSVWVRSLKMGGCIKSDELRECLFGLPDFRTEREDVRQFLVRKYKELAKRAGFDGVRIDAMKHFDSKLVIELRKEFTKINTDMIFIGEYWGSAPDEKWMSVFSEYNVDFLFDFEFRDYLSGFLRGVMRPEVFVSYLNRRYNFAEKGFIVFLNNHDMDGLITHFDDINEKDEGNLLRIMALMQFVSGGAPLIYYGEENGIRVGKGIENRRDMQFSERVMGLRSFYKRLVSLKKKGMLSGKFSAKYENGLLIINIGNMYGEIKAIVNRDRNEKEFQINGNYIKVPSLDCLLIKSDSGGMEYLIPH